MPSTPLAAKNSQTLNQDNPPIIKKRKFSDPSVNEYENENPRDLNQTELSLALQQLQKMHLSLCKAYTYSKYSDIKIYEKAFERINSALEETGGASVLVLAMRALLQYRERQRSGVVNKCTGLQDTARMELIAGYIKMWLQCDNKAMDKLADKLIEIEAKIEPLFARLDQALLKDSLLRKPPITVLPPMPAISVAQAALAVKVNVLDASLIKSKRPKIDLSIEPKALTA